MCIYLPLEVTVRHHDSPHFAFRREVHLQVVHCLLGNWTYTMMHENFKLFQLLPASFCLPAAASLPVTVKRAMLKVASCSLSLFKLQPQRPSA